MENGAEMGDTVCGFWHDMKKLIAGFELGLLGKILLPEKLEVQFSQCQEKSSVDIGEVRLGR